MLNKFMGGHRFFIEFSITNTYLQLTRNHVLNEFKNRITAGEWLSSNEYTDMMFAVRQK